MSLERHADTARPNIVFLLVDDWGFELFPRRSALGDTHKSLLPQLRETFVEEGVELARHYTYSYCAPSRQSLLSGRQPLHVNEENSVCSGIPRGMQTLGGLMKSAGYSTHFVGKCKHAATKVEPKSWPTEPSYCKPTRSGAALRW